MLIVIFPTPVMVRYVSSASPVLTVMDLYVRSAFPVLTVIFLTNFRASAYLRDRANEPNCAAAPLASSLAGDH